MDDETLEMFIRQYIEGQDGTRIVFSWQGGEPTLAGLAFFEKVVQLQAKYAPRGREVENDLQTNGILLDDNWCDFLKRHRFLIGLSIDGPRELHDRCRVDRGGKPTFDRVMQAAQRLRTHGVPFNTLSTIHRWNVQQPLEVYRFLTRELGSTYVQFNPCVEPVDFRTHAPGQCDASSLPIIGTAKAKPGRPDSVVTEWSVNPNDWGRFLCACFDEWYARDVGRVLVNLFETAVAQTLGLPSQICVTGEFCGKGAAMEHDGTVYSCDHFVYPEYRLGNIRDRSIAELILSTRQKEFGFEKRDQLPDYCRCCPCGTFCWGECPKNRLVRTRQGEVGLNYLCHGIQAFHAHARSRLRKIAENLMQET